jgi:hypothetical protein
MFSGRRQPSCDGTSRMTRECHVRICERLGVKFPGPTRHHSPTFVSAILPLDSEAIVPTVKLRASTILGAFAQAQTELVGKAVILTDGKAGTVESVWLDEMHGLRISIKGHDGKWPVSTIKFAQS